LPLLTAHERAAVVKRAELQLTPESLPRAESAHWRLADILANIPHFGSVPIVLQKSVEAGAAV
jgi:hypothetical protein